MLQYYSVMQLWCDFSWQYNLFRTPKIAKNTPLKSKKLVKLTKNLEYRGYLLTFGVEIKRKSASFKTKTNGQTLPKQPQNNFENDLFDPQNSQQWLSHRSKVGYILSENLKFRGVLWIFGDEIKRKYYSFKTKNNAQTLPKQHQNKFEKVQKTTFSTPKMGKNYPSNRSKVGSILTENLNF